MVVWVRHKNIVYFWFFGVPRYRYKTPINIFHYMHSAQRKTFDGEILLPMLPCWQLASGGNGSWDDYAFYRLFTSFEFFQVFLVVNWEGQQTPTISIDFEMQRQPRAISNTWMLHTVDLFTNLAEQNNYPKPSKLRGVMGLVCSSFPKVRCRIVFHFGTGSCWVHATIFGIGIFGGWPNTNISEFEDLCCVGAQNGCACFSEARYILTVRVIIPGFKNVQSGKTITMNKQCSPFTHQRRPYLNQISSAFFSEDQILLHQEFRPVARQVCGGPEIFTTVDHQCLHLQRKRR